MTDMPSTSAPARKPRVGVALVVAILWAMVALVVGIATIQDGNSATGDALPFGHIVTPLGWLIIGTGVLGLIIAGRPR